MFTVVDRKACASVTSRLAITASVLVLACASQPAWAQVSAGSKPATPAERTAAEQAGDATRPAGPEQGTSATGETQAPASAAADSANADDIVVTGVRASLATAQNIKRNSDTVVDAITSQDIGALPDRSVNEALQRVPGVAISRFAAPTDAQHFSAQGSGVVIRGLSYVRSEFNGRDTFAANGARGIGFNDVPSELVGSIEVYKNMTADLIEGGISGTVNINTRKPFDSDKDLLYVSGGMTYGDFEERGAPSGVALLSKQFETGIGRFGVLGSVTYSQFHTRVDSVYVNAYLPRFNDDRNGNGVQDAGEGRTINGGTPFASTLFDTYPVPAGLSRVYVPLGGGYREEHINRDRLGIQGALQFESLDKRLLVTAQYLRTESYEEHLDRTVGPAVYYPDATSTFPVAGTTPTYNSDGIFTSGVLGRNTGQVFGNLPGGAYGPLTQYVANGLNIGATNRFFNSKSITRDHSLNIKFNPTDRLHINLDGQYVKSTATGRDDILDLSTQAQASIDTRGSIPNVQLVTPGFNNAAYFANPNSLYFNDAFNNRNINDGKEWAFRGDIDYDFGDDSFLRKIKVGGRYASRDQTVRTNDYANWGAVSQTWTAGGPISFAQSPANTYGVHSFSNFLRGDTPNGPLPTNFLNADLIQNHDALMTFIRAATKASGGTYVPIEDRVRADGQPLVDGYFLPNEVYRNTEKTYAAYARIDFGKDGLFGGGTNLSGNIGLRWVRTQDRAFGAINFPQATQVFRPDSAGRYTTIAGYCAFRLANPGQFQTIDPLCTISPAQAQAALAFANGGTTPSVAANNFDNFLPSLNLRLDLSPKLLTRFAYSRAISRPDFGNLRNVTTLSPDGGNTSGNYGFSGSTQSANPFLTPIEADQFDLTMEWYFAKVGQLTGTLFYKKLRNIIVDNNGYNRSFTNNGQTVTAQVNGPSNVGGSSNIKGAEVSYQQTFDFLPGFLSGLGAQATYTYVDAGNIPNGVPANAANDGNRPPLDVGGLYDNLPLSGLSKHNFNVAAFYDLHGFAARLAYSWRSKFLLNNRDCCFPFLPIYAQPTGQLDGSMFLTVNPRFKIGVEVQNIANTTTKTRYLLNGQGLEAPLTAFKTDRQFTLSTRLNF